MEFISRILKRDIHAFDNEPQIVIGSIHSVKGAEADCVYIYPDLSTSGDKEWKSCGGSRDSVIRVFYVAITRARESVGLMRARGGMSIDW